MNREIKFRGKRVNNGEWIYGDLIQTEIKEIFFEGILYKVETKSVGQYTGLKDKNGVEIYEGNILKTPEGEYRIDYSEGSHWCINCEEKKNKDFYFQPFILNDNSKDLEVIGNI